MEKLTELEKIIDTGDYVVYRTTCRCGSTDHNLCVILEYDKELDIVSVSMLADLESISWGGDYDQARIVIWVKDILGRIKKAVKLILTGYIKMETDFIFRDRSHAAEFAKALTVMADKLKEEASGTK